MSEKDNDKQMDGCLNAVSEIPKLYETEDVETDKKIIHQLYEIPQIGFYWMIAELDKQENIAYGFANLNDALFAEWGYISIEELLENNAVLRRDWQPCTFKEAQKRMRFS